MYRILLQMVLYHVKLLAPRGGHEVLSNGQTHRQQRIEDLSRNAGFGLEVHEKNRQFMQENEAKFEGWLEGAAHYWVKGTDHRAQAEREELVKAMREMKGELVEVFDVNPVSLSYLSLPRYPAELISFGYG